MEEAELAEIESRIQRYPPQARHDILRLTREVRRLHEAGGGARATAAGSPMVDRPTGLLNRGAYGVRFAAARARATRFRKIFAVMSIDFDLQVMERAERETVAKEISDRLQGCLRATDTLARIDDTAFSIILEDLTQPDHVERVKENVQTALAAPLRSGAREIVLAAQVRVELYPDPHGEGPIIYSS